MPPCLPVLVLMQINRAKARFFDEIESQKIIDLCVNCAAKSDTYYLMTIELTHAYLGQIVLYVNYFDKEVVIESNNQTIGLVY